MFVVKKFLEFGVLLFIKDNMGNIFCDIVWLIEDIVICEELGIFYEIFYFRDVIGVNEEGIMNV